MNTKKDIKSMYYEELITEMDFIGEPEFRAAQIFDWLHKKHVTSFDEMTNISVNLREKLKSMYEIASAEIVDCLISKIDGTKRFALAMPDGNVIEAVLMTYYYGKSLCVSSQVGCRMGCKFCASTLGGLVRNLTAAEMLEEVYRIHKEARERIDHVVIMGCGEPFDNYDNVIRFIRLLGDKAGYDISLRHITVSTCGLVPGILKMAKEGIPVTLAVSLHAPNNEIRKTIMPVAKRWTISKILCACETYFTKTGRRVSFEYCLIGGINDTDASADELAGLLSGKNCHVNLISMNPVPERATLKEASNRAVPFKKRLEKHGINATIRKAMGRDIAGACGQLRNSYLKEKVRSKTGRR